MQTTPPDTKAPIPSARRSIQFLCDFYLPEVHAGVVDYARAAGWALSDWKCIFPSKLLESSEVFDGCLAVVVTGELATLLKAQSFPVVRLLCSEQDLPFPAVEPDCAAIGSRAAEHLLTLGSPTFAFYRSCDTYETRLLWEGFSNTIQASGHQALCLDFAEGRDPATVYSLPRRARWDWLRNQLVALPKPLALFVEDDRYINDVIEAAGMLGLRIPEDIAVVGTDNRALILGKLPFPASSVDSNLHGIGWAGAELLDQILDGCEKPKAPLLVKPKQVVARQSTATFVCDHPAITAAVKFLRTRYREPILVADIAQFANLSTRSLQIAFKGIVGCTISDELARLRLAHAARLLRETDLKLESVAHESGLTSAKYLCEVFRPAFHTTPAAYRESQRQLLGKSLNP